MSVTFLAAVVLPVSACLLFTALRRRWAILTTKQFSGLFWTVCAIGFALSMISHPKEVFDGATTGLKTWWNIVFPSLLPFFIASELLMSFGLVNFIGILMEPLMRPLFNVPGCGSFVMCIGYTSGYPIGAMITARLRSQRLCTRIEAERLIAFTNNSSPLFMIVAVSVGMFGRPELALIIAGAHYLANITLGLLFRFYGRKDRETLPLKGNPTGGIFDRAFRELAESWQKEVRPLGKIMGEAVRGSINSLLGIGGFIILFAVIIKLITAAGIIARMADLLYAALHPLGFPKEIMPSLASGFFEMTIGSKMACETTAPLIHQIAAVEMLLAWSGLSVIAQVASMISDTDIRIAPFIIARLIHAALAAVYTVFVFGPAIPSAGRVIRPATAALEKLSTVPPLFAGLEISGALLLAITALFILAAVLFTLGKLKIYL